MTAKPPSCFMTMLGDAKLNGVLPGLSYQPERGFFPEEKSVTCCGGSGFAAGATEKNLLMRCDFTERLGLVHALARNFCKSWPEHTAFLAAMALKKERSYQILEHLAKGPEHGYFFPVASHGRGPSELWPIAFAAAYRYGYRCHVITFRPGDRRSVVVLPPESFWAGKSPRMVFVEGLDQLWDQKIAVDIATLITQAYNTLTPIWVEAVVRGDKKAEAAVASSAGHPLPASSRLSSQMRRKIARAKSFQLDLWLGADVFAKLRDICQPIPKVEPVTAGKRNHETRRERARDNS